MQIYVISLKDSARRETVAARLIRSGSQFQFIDAVKKESIKDSEKNVIYDRDACRRRHGRELVNGEIACFLSHLKAWKVIEKSNEPAIILEDDAIPTENFSTAVTVLNKECITSDVVLLGHSKLKLKNERRHYFHNPILRRSIYGSTSIGEVFKLWTSGTVGYYLTPRGAKILIEKNNKIKCVVDDWKLHSENGLIVKEIRPYIIWEDFDNMPSGIETERKQVSAHRNSIIDHMLDCPRVIRAIYRNILSVAQRHSPARR